MKKLSVIVIIAISIASCKNSGNQKFQEPVVPATTINVPTPPLTGDSNKQITVANPQPQPAPVASEKATTKGSTALNPKHGEPGHRCDIPEGSPLNSPATNTTIPATGTSSLPVVAQPQPANNVRLNPAHGAPGHDCTVAVGQPLKSK